MFYVYAHYDYKGTCFYIGKGKGQRHLSAVGRNVYWKRIAAKSYKSVILFDNLQEIDAFELEIGLIAKYSPRANLTKGGIGGCTVTEQTKPLMAQKVSKAQKVRWSKLDLASRQMCLKSAHTNNYLKTLSPKQLSVEQKRRNSLKKRKQIKCLSNNKIYADAKQACADLEIKYSSKVFCVCRGTRPHYRGYRFEYVS